MLTGTIPVRGKDAAEVQNNARSGRVVPPQKRRPNLTIPDSLNAVAMKALSLNPDDRYASVQDLYDDVSRYLRGFAPLAENAGPMKRLQLLVKRYNQVSTALLLAGLVLITVIGFSYQRERLQSKKLEIARTEAISNLERYRAEQEVSQTLYRQMLGFTGNVAAFSDVLAFEQAYQFMENELQKDDLATEYRNRLLWNKTQLELANQQFHTAMESIKDCELDRNGSVYDFAKKYAALKPNDEDLLKEEQFAEFLSDDKNSILSRRFKAILLSLAFDLDAARRDAPDPHAYLKVILAQLNQLNNTPGWGKHIALEKVEGGYHLDLRDSPYIRYRLARMAPTPLLDKLQLVSLDLSRNEFRLEDGAAFAGEMGTLVLLDVRTYAVPRLVSALRKIPAKRMVFRKGFLTEGQVRNLGRVHEVIELPEDAHWNLK
jgi:hypothetical protein